MTYFSEKWLSLREPLDRASRSASLGKKIVEGISSKDYSQKTLEIVDLGSGSGANLRYAIPLIGGSQDWSLVDWDPLLSSKAIGINKYWADKHGINFSEIGSQFRLHSSKFDCTIRPILINLAVELNKLDFPENGLVTASALLDLVSEEWLIRLIDRCANAQAFVWFALTYDGMVEFFPSEPEDEHVLELFNKHQLSDKGFGPSLGPHAAARAIEILQASGYTTRIAKSDWDLKAKDAKIQRALVDNWFNSAVAINQSNSSELNVWRNKRLAHIEARKSELVIGHLDFVGWPILTN